MSDPLSSGTDRQRTSKNDLGRDRWPNVTDGDWLRKLAEDTFGDHHMQRDTANRLRQIAARCDGRSSDETNERPMTLGRLVLETARGNVKERVLTPEESRDIGKQLVEIGDKAKAAVRAQFFPAPFRFVEPESDSDINGPHIVDVNGSIVAKLFWPAHPAEATEAAEQETYALGRAMAAVIETSDDSAALTELAATLRTIADRDEKRGLPTTGLENAAREIEWSARRDRPALKANSHYCIDCNEAHDPRTCGALGPEKSENEVQK